MMRSTAGRVVVVAMAAMILGVFGAAGAAEVAKEVKPVVEGNSEFAFDLYGKLREQPGNLFLSPYSISTALGMTYAGARGNTADQMAKVLHLGANDAALHKAFGSLVTDLNAAERKKNHQLSVANALWAQKDYKFLKEFTDLVTTSYEAGLNKVDFKADPDGARVTINKWVEAQTKDKIKDLLKPGVITDLTRLVLTNAIYFKGNWASQFKKDATKDAPFTLADGKKVDVPMMNQTGKFKYGGTDDAYLLELPYVKDELSMLIVLPRKRDGLAEVEKNLSAKMLGEWTKRMWKREVIVSLPKFKMTSEFGLAGVLTGMGMTDAFAVDKADFSGMDGTKYLFISAVVHKAFVDVNEEGTEAAAATAVVVKAKAEGMSGPDFFTADHPFLFLIRDNSTGGILFIGRVANPKQ